MVRREQRGRCQAELVTPITQMPTPAQLGAERGRGTERERERERDRERESVCEPGRKQQTSSYEGCSLRRNIRKMEGETERESEREI